MTQKNEVLLPELSEDEQKMADDFSQKINLHDSDVILQYGTACQKKVAALSDRVLECVSKNSGETCEMLTMLVSELKDFSEDDRKGGFLDILEKSSNKIARMKKHYKKIEINIDRLAGEFMEHQNQLLTDFVMLDKLYEANLSQYKGLTMYIVAGKNKLEKECSETLPAMQAQAESSGQMNDIQAANDFAAMCDFFEQKLHDLEITRTISMQMALQIRMIQNNNALLTEKIQSAVSNTIPLWKNQMIVALGKEQTKQVKEIQQKVSDLTNEQLISTLNELLAIQDEDRQKRQDLVQELQTIKK